MSEAGWALTESDPQVFTQLLVDLGVKGLQVDDLYSLDNDAVDPLKPVHALIFLFKYVGGSKEDALGVPVPAQDCGIWFANQVINNACATVAALNAVMNIPSTSSPHKGESVELGVRSLDVDVDDADGKSELENLREFGSGMESLDLGHVVASSEQIRTVHNSFARSSPFSMDPSLFPEREKEDAYHFVTYLPFNGMLYELDGLQETPLLHGAVGDDWLEQGREAIQQRIATYEEGSVMFNLLAVRGTAIPRLLRQGSNSDELAREREKIRRGKLENTLRKNELLPTIFSLLKAMGEQDLVIRS